MWLMCVVYTGDSGLSAEEGPRVHHSNTHVSPLEGGGQEVRPFLPESSWRQSVRQRRTESYRGPGWRFAVLQCCYPKNLQFISRGYWSPSELDEVDLLTAFFLLSVERWVSEFFTSFTDNRSETEFRDPWSYDLSCKLSEVYLTWLMTDTGHSDVPVLL